MLYDPEVSSWTILLVDDDNDNLSLLATLFTMYGCTIYTALDGDEAMVQLQSIKPDVILSDLAMPRVTGWELLKHIRQEPRLNTVPVIALTAHATQNEPSLALEKGFNAALTKPFHIPELIRTLKESVIQQQTRV